MNIYIYIYVCVCIYIYAFFLNARSKSTGATGAKWVCWLSIYIYICIYIYDVVHCYVACFYRCWCCSLFQRDRTFQTCWVSEFWQDLYNSNSELVPHGASEANSNNILCRAMHSEVKNILGPKGFPVSSSKKQGANCQKVADRLPFTWNQKSGIRCCNRCSWLRSWHNVKSNRHGH